MPTPTIQDIAAKEFCKNTLPYSFAINQRPKNRLHPSTNETKLIYSDYYLSAKDIMIKEKLEKFKKAYFSRYSQFALLNKITIHSLEDNVTKILEEIYSLEPDAVALEMTSDQSIFTSMRCGNKKVYLEYFPENASIGIDQFILNGYKEDEEVINSFSGSLKEVINHLNTHLILKKIVDIKGSPKLQLINVNLPVNSVTSGGIHAYSL